MHIATPSAAQIQVSHAEQILWLPLRIIDSGRHNENWSADWVEDTDNLRPGIGGEDEDQEDDERYGEYLYFHPTLRNFIWGQAGVDAHRPLRRWRRKQGKPDFLDVLLTQGQDPPHLPANPAPDPNASQTVQPYTLRLKVEDLALYAVGPQPDLVILALRWSVSALAGQLSLAQLQDLLECVRRTHMGYFPGESRSPVLHAAGGRVPLAARWSFEDASGPLQVDMQQLAVEKKGAFAAIQARKTPMLAHWRALLGHALVNGTEQIEDERMPYMAYVRVADPLLISRADWVRLALADYRGSHVSLPYGAAFLEDFERKHCYDRFFDPTVSYKSSRILNAGYAFTMVGAESDDFYRNVAARHFSGHYAWMGLLLQYNKAALLNFSRRLAESSAKLVDGNDANDSEYGDDIRPIQRELVAFTHRHWFDGFTNQIQGQEIGTQWGQLLGLPSLYESVKNEAEMAYQLVVAEEARRQTLEAANQTQLVTKLTKWGLRFGLVGLVVALAGGAFPIDKPLSIWPEGICFTCGFDLPRIFTLVILYGLLGGLAYWLDRRINRNSHQPPVQNPSQRGSA